MIAACIGVAFLAAYYIGGLAQEFWGENSDERAFHKRIRDGK